jgi:hypothetical protein
MLQVDDEEEVRYSQRVMQLFDRAAEIEVALEPKLEPVAGSALFADDVRSPHHSVSDYAMGQLHVAGGCIASLKRMMVREAKDEIHMVASPFGAYALIRNSMDAAAVALWLLEPGSGTLRIKRRITLSLDELHKAGALRQTMGQPSIKIERQARLQEVALQAGMGDWNPLREKLPPMTEILKNLERLHSGGIFPWLAAWQLSSGHAHGKQWAQISSNELEEIEGTRTATGARFQMTIRYGMLAAVLFEAVLLLEAAGSRYFDLSSVR